MIGSSNPTLVPVPFASGAGTGYINPIPIPSQIVGGSDPGLASMTDGFTPRTFIELTAGGLPPRGQDFNGILNLHSTAIQWAQLGCRYVYNATFQTSIGGYPKGAILSRSDLTGAWISTVDNNATNPETGGAGWLPHEGSTIIQAVTLTSASVTLTALQAAAPIITLSGALTANVNLVFPAWVSAQWLIVNNCTGNFTVTATTGSGTTVALSNNTAMFCNAGGLQAVVGAGQLLKTTVITSTQTFTPSLLANTTRIRGVGPSGGSGGCPATSSTTAAASIGGACGGSCEAIFGRIPGAQTVTVGAPGAAGAVGGNGGDAADITFGSLMTIPGGQGGIAGVASTALFVLKQNGFTPRNATVTGSGQLVWSTGTAIGGESIVLGPAVNQQFASPGTPSPFGYPASGYGSGRPGVVAVGSSAGVVGTVGNIGFLIVEEYS